MRKSGIKCKQCCAPYVSTSFHMYSHCKPLAGWTGPVHSSHAGPPESVDLVNESAIDSADSHGRTLIWSSTTGNASFSKRPHMNCFPWPACASESESRLRVSPGVRVRLNKLPNVRLTRLRVSPGVRVRLNKLQNWLHNIVRGEKR